MSISINPKEFWETIGRSDDARDSFMIRENEEEYWESGKIDAKFLIDNAKVRGLKKPEVILEYGCGDGRIVRFISPMCKKFICADISESVLKLAYNQLSVLFGLKNLDYEAIDSLEEKREFADFIYSLHVMQHNPLGEQKRIMQNIYNFLKPGGLACVHFAALETKPGYQNCDTCMCFTREQTEELAEVFDSFEITLEEFGGTSGGDYFVWGKKKI